MKEFVVWQEIYMLCCCFFFCLQIIEHASAHQSLHSHKALKAKQLKSRIEIATERNTQLPISIIGWDSLQNQIKYPEIARRAGVVANFRARVEVDSLGNTLSVTVLNDSIAPEIFKSLVKDVLHHIQWRPAIRYGMKFTSAITIPFSFTLDDTLSPIIQIRASTSKFYRKIY